LKQADEKAWEDKQRKKREKEERKRVIAENIAKRNS